VCVCVCVCVCVRVCVCACARACARARSSSNTQLKAENAFFPTAIHVLSQCGISYFADITGLLHTTIQFCKAIMPDTDYTQLFFLQFVTARIGQKIT